MKPKTQFIVKKNKREVFLRREDLIHPQISGNKYRKLKYQLEAIVKSPTRKIVTFGGAYSNHIAAVALAGKLNNLVTIGIIRGEELEKKVATNPTLNYAQQCGMQLRFVSREAYKQKDQPVFIENLQAQLGDFHLIPEGGTNTLAVKGCAEILQPEDSQYNYIAVSVGTGGTLAGIAASLQEQQFALGFSALKGTFQKEVVAKHTKTKNYDIIDTYNFNGYAKIDGQLIRFINDFKASYGVLLDPVYTGKMMYGIFDLIEKEYFVENSRILAIHTGGLQGIAGMNQLLKKKNLTPIAL